MVVLEDLCPGRKTCKKPREGREFIMGLQLFLLLNKCLFAALNLCTLKIIFCNIKDIDMIHSVQFC